MDGVNNMTGGIPLNVTLHAWPVPQLNVPPHVVGGRPAAGHVAPSNASSNHRLLNLNATGFVAVEDDATDTGFTDVQTLILAGIATLIPLLIAVGTVFTVRFIWRKYRERKGEGYEGVLQREDSSEPLSKIQTHTAPQELKTSESQFTVTPSEEPPSTTSPQVLTPKSNGSVITMTLKNNHLIVETEETSDSLDGIKIESKGTTTKYVTPSTVELRGMEQFGVGANPVVAGERDHGALVHRPPEEEPEDNRSSNTGLSQSDLSMSSSGSNNPSYRYGNQSEYDAGGYGYQEYPGYVNLEETVTRAKLATVENITSVREPRLTRTDSTVSNNEGAALRDILTSDIQAREVATLRKEEDRHQKEQAALGNGELTHDSNHHRRSSDVNPETTAALDKKRASLPTFTPLSAVKGSRFDQLKNEMSPLEEVERHPFAAGNGTEGPNTIETS